MTLCVNHPQFCKCPFFSSLEGGRLYLHRPALFEMVGKIEKEHEARYRKLLANIEGGLVFSCDGDQVWQCGNCGHIVIGKKSPELCPVCKHPKAYFQIRAQNY